MRVQWGEMDALGHVNNVQFIRYFETARVHLMESIGLWKMFDKDGIMIVLAKMECNFIQPLYYPDTILAQARFKSIGRSSMVVEQQVVSKTSGLAAQGDGIIVFVDPKTGKSTPIPDSVRTLVESYLG